MMAFSTKCVCVFLVPLVFIYTLIYLFLPHNMMYLIERLDKGNNFTQNSANVKMTEPTARKSLPRIDIRQVLYRHINQTAANVTRNRLKRFSPYRLLRVYRNELIQNQTYTETAQANGEPWIKPADTCAVLGNSGILHGSNCGLEIDAHDHVFRSNMAPLEGFEEDVGTRTTLITINSDAGRSYGWCSQNKNDCYQTKSRYLNNLNNSTIIWVTKASTRYLKMGTVNALRKLKPNVVLARPSSLLSRAVKRRWNITSSPSSGLYLFSLAGNMCSKVSLYGFYPFNQTANGKPVKYHYYGGSASFQNGHRMPAEFTVLKQLNASGIIRLVTSPCAFS